MDVLDVLNPLRLTDLILSGTAFLASLVLIWAYTWGNAWYASRVGRALVALAAGIALLLGGAVVHRALGHSETDWFTTTALAVVNVIVGGLDVAFLRERRDVRGRARARVTVSGVNGDAGSSEEEGPAGQ